MVNFVCIIFEQGVKMFTLSSMGNLIVECNLKKKSRDHLKGYKLTHCAHCAKNVQNQKISSGVGGGGGGGAGPDKFISHQHMGLDATKPVFGVSEKARLKPVSSAI